MFETTQDTSYYDEEIVYDEDGDTAFAEMLERRAENGNWFGRSWR